MALCKECAQLYIRNAHCYMRGMRIACFRIPVGQVTLLASLASSILSYISYTKHKDGVFPTKDEEHYKTMQHTE